MTGCGSSRLDISPNSDEPFCLGIQSICGILKIQWASRELASLYSGDTDPPVSWPKANRLRFQNWNPMTTLSDKQLHDLARLGAIARLKELDQEAAALRKMFPGMKQATEQAAEPAPAAPKAKRNKGRMMSKSARKTQSEKMKAYWAKKKA